MSLEIKDASDTQKRLFYFDYHFEMSNEGRLRTKLFH